MFILSHVFPVSGLRRFLGFDKKCLNGYYWASFKEDAGTFSSKEEIEKFVSKVHFLTLKSERNELEILETEETILSSPVTKYEEVCVKKGEYPNSTETVRLYKLSLAELLDRLTILQLKEIKIPENRESYALEIQEILFDIDSIILEEEPTINANFLRSLIVLAQYNGHIWNYESEARKGKKDGNQLMLTHSLNGIRNTAKNKIQESLLSGRKDLKVDCLAAEFCTWEPSWEGK